MLLVGGEKLRERRRPSFHKSKRSLSRGDDVGVEQVFEQGERSVRVRYLRMCEGNGHVEQARHADRFNRMAPQLGSLEERVKLSPQRKFKHSAIAIAEGAGFPSAL